MTFSARHIFGLAAAVVLIVCVFFGIGYHRALHRALAVPPISPDVSNISRLISAYHALDETPGLTRSLSKTLAPAQPIRGLAFAIFSAFTPREKRVAAYWHHAQFGPVRGMARAAEYHFGVHHAKLAVGEVLLLCDLAQGADQPMRDPIAALHRRDALLSALHASGFLSLAEYRDERERALSLSTDHRPVN